VLSRFGVKVSYEPKDYHASLCLGCPTALYSFIIKRNQKACINAETAKGSSCRKITALNCCRRIITLNY